MTQTNKVKLTKPQLELWLADPVTRAFLQAIREDDKVIEQVMSGGGVGYANSADQTQASYFENLGRRQGLGRAADPYTLINNHFEVEGEEEDTQQEDDWGY